MEKAERVIVKIDMFHVVGNHSGKVLSIAVDSMLKTTAQQKQCQCKRKPKELAV